MFYYAVWEKDYPEDGSIYFLAKDKEAAIEMYAKKTGIAFEDDNYKACEISFNDVLKLYLNDTPDKDLPDLGNLTALRLIVDNWLEMAPREDNPHVWR